MIAHVSGAYPLTFCYVNLAATRGNEVFGSAGRCAGGEGRGRCRIR